MTATLSHETGSFVPRDERVDRVVAEITARLHACADDLVLPLPQELRLLHELAEFDFGRFLLLNGGLSGYWTSYVFTHDGTDAPTDMEQWLLSRSTMAGIRQRYHRLSALVAPRLHPGARVASIPCGLMDDVLAQPPELLADVTIVGVDIDAESIALAAESAAERGLNDRTEFVRGDAWELELGTPVDLLLSNGLNLYEPDRDRLVELYRRFRDNLAPGGELLVSFIPPLPPPPDNDPVSAVLWQRLGMSADDVRRDRAVFGDLLSVTYLNLTSTDELAAQLREAGLSLTSVHYAEYGVLPIAVARRSDDIDLF
nr:methyltransferase domain-containing protein [Rhodococcus sp. (in: high G+C Gram-positive bacteria)]